jgi:hypothetical protein
LFTVISAGQVIVGLEPEPEPTKVCPVLISPDEAAVGPLHVKSPYKLPVPISCNDSPMGEELGSDTPISVEVIPFAVPEVAVKEPS